MKIHHLLFLTILCNALYAGDSVNVASMATMSIRYVGNLPLNSDLQPNLIRMNPHNLTDLKYNTYVEFPSPSNIGSSILIEMPEPIQIAEIACPTLGNFASTLRLRKHAIYGGLDTVNWVLLFEGESTDTVSVRVKINSESAWKYIKIVILSQLPTYSTVISECEVWQRAGNSKVISSLTVGNPAYSDGESMRQVQWQSLNMTATDSVNIYVKTILSDEFVLLASNELNDGSFTWNTTFIPNGVTGIKIVPIDTTVSIGRMAVVTIENFVAAEVFYNNRNYNTATEANRRYWSYYRGDSLKIEWNFTAMIKKDYSYRLQYSLDSGKTWNAITTINDTTVRMYYWKIPKFTGYGLYSFFAVDILYDMSVINRIVSKSPAILSGSVNAVVARWTVPHANYSANRSGHLASLVSSNGGGENIVFSPAGMVTASGDTVPGFIYMDALAANAVSDIDGDGKSETIIANSWISEDGTRIVVDSTYQHFGTPMAVAFNADGPKEVIMQRSNAFSVFDHQGTMVDAYSFPNIISGITLCSVDDIDGDGIKEMVYATRGYNELHVFDRAGNIKPGFPKKVLDIFQTSTVTADLFKTGKKCIVVAARNNLFCFDHHGNIVEGFPVVLPFQYQLDSKIAIADIDNDLFLDIVFSTKQYYYGTSETRSMIYCIDRFGKNLPGWPVLMNDDYIYPYIQSTYGYDELIKVGNYGNMRHPYIVSIDGDWHNEVIFANDNGFLYVFDYMGNAKSGYPMFLGVLGTITPHFGDFDNDGSLNMIATSIRQWETWSVNYDFGPGTYNKDRMPWPTFMQNVERTGIAPQSIPVSVRDGGNSVPKEFLLSQNYPNPFNPSTKISFTLPENNLTTLKVYDILGKEITTIVNRWMTAGTHTVEMPSLHLNSGIYFYTLRSGKQNATKKMIVVK